MRDKFSMILCLLVSFCFSMPAIAQSTCQDDKPMPLPQVIAGPDTTEHASKSHWAATGVPVVDSNGNPQQNTESQAITGQCGYRHGTNANCTTTCTVNLTGSPSTAELGTLNVAGTHMVNSGWLNGTATGSGAATSCTGYFGAGAANCFMVLGTCLPSVTVNASGVTISTGGSKVWTSQPNPAPLNCAAKVDPQNQRAAGLPPPPPGGEDPPCDLGFAGNTQGPCSPIIIDAEGEGFHLTSAGNGVTFDIRGDGHPIQISWTATGFRNAFLALPGANGLVHNGKELFGNFTLQPVSNTPNGFLALAEFDKPENGGNGDGIIDEHDAVYSRLRLWIDENHDGVSQLNELHTLPELGVLSLSLGYFASRKVDEFGNEFRYKARVNPRREHRGQRDEPAPGEVGRWTYDVFLTTRNP